ncbi:MAG TPA: diacylglycerol kinase family protein [Sphingomonas sp.]|nr:diacylglycerol kinase family protein [Sphingomonas sp.]
MAPRTVQLFVNDTAGSWSRGRTRALHDAFVAAGARVIVTDCGADELTIDPDADHVCVVGGDGTLRHVATAAARATRALTMSIYPSGTVNLVARERRYPREPKAFVARALSGTAPRRHYFAMIGDVPLAGVASVGPDSYAVARLSPRLKRVIGRAAYVVAFLAVLIRWSRPQLQVTAGERVVACEAVYIAKGRFFAGPWSFAPQAAVDQPLLHVVALTRATRTDYLRFIWALARGRGGADHPNLIRFACTEIDIAGAANVPLQGDGDIVSSLPARLRLNSETLAFA